MSEILDSKSILKQIEDTNTKLGDIRKIAKAIKKDHSLAMELWSTGNLNARRLALLIMDKKELDEAKVNALIQDMTSYDEETQTHLMEWFMTKQLSKDKKGKQLMESWEDAPEPLQRRTYWYYKARQRWMGQEPPEDNAEILKRIESKIEQEVEMVQWAMNFTAAWIGVFDEQNRAQCIALGEKTGLYKDEIVPRNCTPSYLPAFIEVEVAKRK